MPLLFFALPRLHALRDFPLVPFVFRSSPPERDLVHTRERSLDTALHAHCFQERFAFPFS